MADKIKRSYKRSKNVYDDVLTQSKWWSRLYIKFFWQGVDDNIVARDLLSWLKADFDGEILDVPVGTAVFTYGKYKAMKKAGIVCVDYSEDMLSQAKKRFSENGIENAKTMQGDVGKLPFEKERFDVVLSMNGFHAFPDKEKAYKEVDRVLKPGGTFLACYYIKGKSKRTDRLVECFLAKKGWFTPPFETESSLRERLAKDYTIERFETRGSIVLFKAIKK